MTRIGDSDLALAFFRDQRGITLDEVSRGVYSVVYHNCGVLDHGS
jgi:hypothetical protein